MVLEKFVWFQQLLEPGATNRKLFDYAVELERELLSDGYVPGYDSVEDMNAELANEVCNIESFCYSWL